MTELQHNKHIAEWSGVMTSILMSELSKFKSVSFRLHSIDHSDELMGIKHMDFVTVIVTTYDHCEVSRVYRPHGVIRDYNLMGVGWVKAEALNLMEQIQDRRILNSGAHFKFREATKDPPDDGQRVQTIRDQEPNSGDTP